MKCGIKVNNRQCKRNVTSGCTIDMLDSVVYCCIQHYAQYKDVLFANIPLYISTEKVINQKESNTMDTTNGIPNLNITAKGAPGMNESGINMSKEDTMNTNSNHQGITVPIGYEPYDEEHTFAIALAQLEGQPYTTYAMQNAGNFLIEVCNHEDCDADHFEMINECRGEICCGEANCQHYTAMPCLHHIPNNTPKEEEIMNTTIKPIKTIACGHCKGTHNTVQEVADCYGVVRTHNSSFQHTNRPMVTKFDDGGKREWFSAKKAAFARADELKKSNTSFTIKPAKNGNGWNIFIKS